MSEPRIQLLSTMPSIAPGLATSMSTDLLRRFTGNRPTTLPDRQIRLADQPQSTADLAAYDKVCGFTVRDHVPATWLHVMHFPLQMALLSAKDSPFSLAGILHATNSMTLYRPVSVTERLTLASSYGPPREHRRGVLIDMVGEAYAGDELVWRGVSAYLVRDGALPGMGPEKQPGGVDLPSEFEQIAADAVWRLPADLGRRYAKVSGDVNPIHLSPVAARAFGLPRAIIHGMWTHARVLAALENRLPETYRMDVRFTKPILLPSTVRFGAQRDGDDWNAVVRNRDGDKAHMTARITPLP